MAIANSLDDILKVARKTANEVVGNKTTAKALYSSGVDDAAKAAKKIVKHNTTAPKYDVEAAKNTAKQITKYNTTAPRYDIEAAKDTAKQITKYDTTSQYVGNAGGTSNQLVRYNTTTSPAVADNRELAKQTAKKYQNASQEPKRIDIDQAKQTANEIVNYNSNSSVPVNNPRYTNRTNAIELDDSQYKVLDDDNLLNNRTNKANSGNFETSSSGGGNGSGGGGGNKNTTGGPESGPNNNSGDSNKKKNSKTRERMNREFNEKFGSFTEGAKDTFLGGIMDSYDNVRYGEQGLFEGIKNAHINDDGSINWRRAAGTFMTTSAAARVASGGGLYKDRYGNPNLIGVPFI